MQRDHRYKVPGVRSGRLAERPALRRIGANLRHLLVGKGAAGVMSLLYLVIVTHSLGARDYGVLILVNAYVVLVGAIVAFSGFHGIVRYGALALQEGDVAGMARLARFMALVEISCGIVAIAISAVAAGIVGPHLGWSSETVELAVPYSLAVIATVRAVPQGVLQIADRFDVLGWHQMISPCVRLAGAALVWLGGGGLPAFLIVWLIAAVAEGVTMWIFGIAAWRRIAAGERLLGPWRGVLRRNHGLGRFLLVTNVDLTLREFAPNLAPLIVGWVLGPAAAGLLALAQRASSVLQQPAMLLSQASYAVMAEQAASHDLMALRDTVWRSLIASTAVGLPFVGLLALLGQQILALLGGSSFAEGTGLLIVVAIGRLVALCVTPVAAGLAALGKPHYSLSVALVTNVALLPLLPVMLWLWHVDGAGWHSLTQSITAAAVLIVMGRKEFYRA